MPKTFGTILSSKVRSKIPTNSQINPRTTDENKNSKVPTIKIILDSSAGAPIIQKYVLHKPHKIITEKKYSGLLW